VTRLAINAVFLRPRTGGLETYVRELVPAMMARAPELRVTLFLAPDGVPVARAWPWASEARIVVVGRPGLKALTETTVLGARARRCDVLHSPALTGPLRTPAAHVVTIADTTWITHPDPAEGTTFALWRAIVPPVARRAARVIAIAEAGARDVVRHLGVPRERVDVVSPGFGAATPPPPTPEPDLRARLGLGEGPLVLAVGQKRAHKNLRRLVRAMARVPEARLVLPGEPTPHEGELRALAAALGVDVAFPAFVSAADLEGLYAAASCFVIASLAEGFGIPVLEAQRRGVPVACSRGGALPEAAGPGARYFDPYDELDLAEAIRALLGDPALAARLVAAGQAHQAKFTWARAAEGTLATYERARAAGLHGSLSPA
jgi:glycosyltransferase involved in cell wall biosynthesis